MIEQLATRSLSVVSSNPATKKELYSMGGAMLNHSVRYTSNEFDVLYTTVEELYERLPFCRRAS